VDKCILLCRNCHAELHHKIFQKDIDAKRQERNFDRNNNKLCNKNKLGNSPCLICGKINKENLKYCSEECFHISTRKIDWDNINLIEELKIKSISKLARELNCSDNAINRRLKKLGLK